MRTERKHCAFDTSCLHVEQTRSTSESFNSG